MGWGEWAKQWPYNQSIAFPNLEDGEGLDLLISTDCISAWQSAERGSGTRLTLLGWTCAGRVERVDTSRVPPSLTCVDEEDDESEDGLYSDLTSPASDDRDVWPNYQ